MKKPRLVVVDDAAFIREVLTQLLSKNGFDVVGDAVDGEEGVEVVLREQPDLVIMDIVMPKLSGVEATKQILKKSPNMKILACSTEGSEGIVSQAIEAGCVDFVTKPFNGSDLIQLIQKHLEDS